MEKFGLLNLLKALETLTPKNNTTSAGQPDAETPPPAAKPAAPAPEPEPDLEHNVMFKVLSRHEQTANRIKNNRR